MSKRGLPSVVSNIPRDLRTFVDRLRDMFADGSIDRLVTLRDLTNAGVAGVDPSGNITLPGSTKVVPPPAPTGVVVVGAVTNIIVSWDDPKYPGHSYAEIWSSPANDIGLAVLAGMSPGSIFTDSVGFSTTRYYWIRFVNILGEIGPYNGLAGIGASTAVNVEYLLDTLEGQITESQLYADLGARIDLIDAPATQVGSVAQRLSVEAAARADAILAEAASRSDNDAALQTQINMLSAAGSGDFSELLAAVQEEQTARIAGDAAEAAARETLAARVTSTETGLTTQASQIADRYTKAESNSAISSASSALVAAYQAADAFTLNSAVAHTNAAIQSEQTARASADSALSSQITTLSATVNTNNTTLSAAIQNEATARANTDAAVSRSVSTLQASAGTGGLIYNGSFANGSAEGWAGLAGVSSAPYGGLPKAYAGIQTGRDIFFPNADASQWMACRPGDEFEVSAWVSAQAASPGYGIGIQYERTNGNTETWTTVASSAAPTTAKFLRGYWTAPSDARRVRFWGQIDTSGTENAWHITDVQLRRTDARTGSNTAAIQTEAEVRASQTGALFAQYTVKVDVNGYVSGFGLASSANNSTPSSSFGVRADQFYIASPSGPGIAPSMPFIVQTTPTTINGQDVPVGVYIREAAIQNGTITNAKIAKLAVDNGHIVDLTADKIRSGKISVDHYIESSNYLAGTQGWRINGNGNAEFGAASIRGQLSASQIDSRGLSIKDANGNVILAAGTALQPQFVVPNGANLVQKATFADGSKGSWDAASVSYNDYGNAASGNFLIVDRRDTHEGGNQFPVVVGESLYVSASITSWQSPYSCSVGLAFLNAAGNIFHWIGGATNPPMTGWARRSGKITVPSGAVRAMPWVQIDGPGNQSLPVCWVTEIYIGRQQEGATVGAPNGTYVGDTLAQNVESLAGATAKANAAQTAAEAYALAKADLKRTEAQAYADGIVTAEETRAIADATAKAEAARVAAIASAASGSNLCPNSDFSNGTTNWTTNSNPFEGVFSINGAGGYWVVNGGVGDGSNTASIHQGNDLSSGYFEALSDPIPVESGKRYCVSAYTGAHRAVVDVFVYWYNGSGAISNSGADIDFNNENYSGGQQLSNYKRHQQFGVAPNDALYARVALRKFGTKPGYTNSWAFIARVQFEQVGALATSAGPWSASGASKALQAALTSYATAQAEAARVTAEAHADGIVTAAEQRAIADATAKAEAARAAAVNAAATDAQYRADVARAGAIGVASEDASNKANWARNTAVNDVTPSINAKLSKAGDTISGRFNFAVADGMFAGSDTNNGVYFGKDGLFGRKWGQNTFYINTAGDAVFSGTLDAATMNSGRINLQHSGGWDWGYARSYNKWWDDGQNGWVMSRHADGSTFAEMRAGSNRIWMSSWNDCGIQFPGITMTNGGLTISQANVIDTLQIAGQAVTVPSSAFTAASIAGVLSTWTTVQSIAVTLSGSRVYIASSANSVDGSAQVGDSDVSAPNRFRLLRGSTVLMTNNSAAMSFSEQPDAGTHTYYLQLLTNGSITLGSASNRSLFVIETKR